MASSTPSEDAPDPHLRKPQQDRSRRTLRRILDAGAALLAQEGPEALTVARITQRSRTSVGSFYARFSGKDDLLRYMGAQALEDALAQWDELRPELHADRSLVIRISQLVRGLTGLFAEGPGETLLLLEGIEDPHPGRRRELEDRIASDLQKLLDAPVVRTELAARVILGVLREGAQRRRLDGEDSTQRTLFHRTHALTAELTELIAGYLGTDDRDRGSAPAHAVPAPSPAPLPAPLPAPPPVALPTASPDLVPTAPAPTPSPAIPHAPEEGSSQEETTSEETPTEPDPFEVWE